MDALSLSRAFRMRRGTLTKFHAMVYTNCLTKRDGTTAASLAALIRNNVVPYRILHLFLSCSRNRVVGHALRRESDPLPEGSDSISDSFPSFFFPAQ